MFGMRSAPKIIQDLGRFKQGPIRQVWARESCSIGVMGIRKNNSSAHIAYNFRHL